mgnify:CR=1 FL=1
MLKTQRHKKIIFYSYDTEIKRVCCCFITDASHDVFRHNCPVYKNGLSSGSCLDGWSGGIKNRVCISVDKDYYEKCSVNPEFTRSILSNNFKEIENIARKCPFNAEFVTNPPKVDKSVEEVKFNKKLITSFDVQYADSVHCPCALGVEAFDVFRKICPVCKSKNLGGDSTITQKYIYGDSRSLDVCVDKEEYERDFFALAYDNVKKIQEIIKTCKYYRKNYIEKKVMSKTK